MGYQHDFPVVTQLGESCFEFFYAILYSMSVYGLFLCGEVASPEAGAVIGDQSCASIIADRLSNIRPDCCVVPSAGFEQNWYPTSFQDVKMQTITSHIDEDVGFLRSG